MAPLHTDVFHLHKRAWIQDKSVHLPRMRIQKNSDSLVESKVAFLISNQLSHTEATYWNDKKNLPTSRGHGHDYHGRTIGMAQEDDMLIRLFTGQDRQKDGWENQIKQLGMLIHYTLLDGFAATNLKGLVQGIGAFLLS